MENIEELEIYDNLKTKVLKYVLYKKRTEREIRQKFINEDENMLDNVIQELKDQNYISDSNYVERAINEFLSLNNLSVREISYKLCQKGIDKNLVDEYICQNEEKMLEYEINSAKAIISKKVRNSDIEEVINFLYKKGYKEDSIKTAVQEWSNE